MEPSRSISQSVYELLTDEEDARVCSDISEEACRETPRSFVLILVAQFLTRLGDALVSPKTVLAWVMSSVQAPVGLIGFLVPIRESGSLIPQLVIASRVRRLPVRKWVWITDAVLQALALLGIWFIPAAYFALSVAHDGVRVGRKTYVVDLASGNRRTDYVSVSNTVIGLVLLAAGLAGTLAAVISVSGVILLLSIMGLAAGGVPAGGGISACRTAQYPVKASCA